MKGKVCLKMTKTLSLYLFDFEALVQGINWTNIFKYFILILKVLYLYEDRGENASARNITIQYF